MRKLLLLAVVAIAAASGCAHQSKCCPPDAKDCEHAAAANKSCSCPEGACPHRKAPAAPAAPEAPAAPAAPEAPAAPAAPEAPATPVVP